MSEPDPLHAAVRDANPYATPEIGDPLLETITNRVEYVTQLDDKARNAAREEMSAAHGDMHTTMAFGVIIVLLECIFLAVLVGLVGIYATAILLCGITSIALHVVGISVLVWYMNRVAEYRDRHKPELLEKVFEADAKYWCLYGVLLVLNLVVTGMLILGFTV